MSNSATRGEPMTPELASPLRNLREAMYEVSPRGKMKRLRPFFSFFGSKWRIARKYPAPSYGRIVGAFAGSAGYELLHHRAEVRLIEEDQIIASVWRYLIRTSACEIRRLPLLEAGESVDDLPVCEEAKALVGFWLNKATTHPCRTASAWMRDPRYRSQFWGEEIRERIASQVDQIRHWRVQRACYSTAPDIKATWFVDPPYEGAGAAYKHGSSGIDYAHLADWCRSRKGQVIVCENEGAQWLPFTSLCPAKATHGKQRSGVSLEVIWHRPAMS